MIGEPARTQARHWEEDGHQDQRLMRSLEQVNRSTALHSPKLQRASCSLSVLFPRPLHINSLHLLLNQATRCLVVDPQHKPVAGPMSCLQWLPTTFRTIHMAGNERPSLQSLSEWGCPGGKPRAAVPGLPDCTNPC